MLCVVHVADDGHGDELRTTTTTTTTRYGGERIGDSNRYCRGLNRMSGECHVPARDFSPRGDLMRPKGIQEKDRIGTTIQHDVGLLHDRATILLVDRDRQGTPENRIVGLRIEGIFVPQTHRARKIGFIPTLRCDRYILGSGCCCCCCCCY